ELEVGEAAESDAGLRVDPEEGSAAAEVTERPLRVPRPRPVRGLAVAKLETEPPVVRVLPAEAGQHAGQSRELNSGRLGERLGRDERRRQQLTADREQIVERSRKPGPGPPFEPGAETERPENSLPHVVAERHP